MTTNSDNQSIIDYIHQRTYQTEVNVTSDEMLAHLKVLLAILSTTPDAVRDVTVTGSAKIIAKVAEHETTTVPTISIGQPAPASEGAAANPVKLTAAQRTVLKAYRDCEPFQARKPIVIANLIDKGFLVHNELFNPSYKVEVHNRYYKCSDAGRAALAAQGSK